MSVILLIDDSSSDRNFITDSLESIGFTVKAVSNGQLALDYLNNQLGNDQFPDLIVTDVVMPEINGYQLIRLLKQQPETQHIPIVVVSIKNQPNDIKWSLLLGATAFVSKPIDVEVLIRTIRTNLKN